MKKIQKGFSLVELMVVIAIIAILAAVAIPMYSNYTNRAKISGEIAQLGAAKTIVAEAANTGNFANMPTTSGNASIEPGTTLLTAAPTTGSAAAAGTGTISMASDAVSGATIYLAPFQSGSTAPVQFQCVVQAADNVASQIPSTCTYSAS